MIKNEELLKVESKLQMVIKACQAARNGKTDSVAYKLLVDIEDSCHNNIKEISREVNNAISN